MEKSLKIFTNAKGYTVNAVIKRIAGNALSDCPRGCINRAGSLAILLLGSWHCCPRGLIQRSGVAGQRFASGLLLVILLSLGVQGQVRGEAVVLADFTQHGIEQWQQQHFVGQTDYRLRVIDGQRVLSATAQGSASALYLEIDIDVRATPYLQWSWRVDNVLNIDSALTKGGDDYAARIYIVVKYGIFPWQSRALNYIWCNKTTALEYWLNPFTEKAAMIPVRCGEQGLGQWQSQQVNILQDYQRIFNRPLERIHGIAVMTDADNSGSRVSADYRTIGLSSTRLNVDAYTK